VSRDFELRFPIVDLPKYAGLYDYPGEAAVDRWPVAHARTRGQADVRSSFVAIGQVGRASAPGNARPPTLRACRRGHRVSPWREIHRRD